MHDLPYSLQKDLDNFVAKIKSDEEKDEEERLKRHLALVKGRIQEAFNSIRLDIKPAQFAQLNDYELFNFVRLMVIPSQTGQSDVQNRPSNDRKNNRKAAQPLPRVSMAWFILLGAWALAATLALSFMLGGGSLSPVNTEPVSNPVETQVLD
jgi:hypothetical protein